MPAASLFLVTWTRQVGFTGCRPDEWQVEAAFVMARNEEEACAKELLFPNGLPLTGFRHDLIARRVDDSGGVPVMFNIATYFDD